MAQISVNNLTFSYEGSYDNIFENVSFSIDSSWRLGLIGRNGKGKTTLLNLLMNRYGYSGTISGREVFDSFPYNISEDMKEQPAASFAEQLKPCEIWRVICELERLGNNADILYRPYGKLSPGEQTKIMLAVLFSGDNEFLLIDEPTNHLDAEARGEVARYLSGKKGFILVSHDRELLDKCVDHILVLNRCSIEVQNGNFSTWWENKQRRDRFSIDENEKHMKEIKRLRRAAEQTAAWAAAGEKTKIGFDPVSEHDRNISSRAYIAAKSKKLQSRAKDAQKRINREIEEKKGLLADIEEVGDLKLTPLVHYKATQVNIRDFSFRYEGAERAILENLNLKIETGDRIVLNGKNGSGKTTLMKLLLSKVGMYDIHMTGHEEGCFEVASGLKISYVGQDISVVKGSVKEFCAERNIDESLFCAVMRLLGTERVQFSKRIEEYSDGQKKKVMLAASLLTPAHLYIWDEPLNGIDVFSRMQLEELLLKYKPTMLFAEHDTTFRNKIATGSAELPGI